VVAFPEPRRRSEGGWGRRRRSEGGWGRRHRREPAEARRIALRSFFTGPPQTC